MNNSTSATNDDASKYTINIDKGIMNDSASATTTEGASPTASAAPTEASTTVGSDSPPRSSTPSLDNEVGNVNQNNDTPPKSSSSPSSPPPYRTPSPTSKDKSIDKDAANTSPPPAINRANISPNTKVAELPPKKNALFSMWGEKTKNSTAIVPDKALKPAPGGGGPGVGRGPYAGKRWSPPKKKDVAPAAASNISRGSPPSQRFAAAAAKARETSPSSSTSTKPAPSTPPRKESPSSSPTVPPPLARNKTPSPTNALPPAVSASSSSAAAAGINKASPSRKGPNTGPSSINDLEGELQELRELKKQLEISSGIASQSLTPDRSRAARAKKNKNAAAATIDTSKAVPFNPYQKKTAVKLDGMDAVNTKALKQEIAEQQQEDSSDSHVANNANNNDHVSTSSSKGSKSSSNNKKKKKSAPIHSFWQQKTVDSAPLKVDKKVPFSGYGRKYDDDDDDDDDDGKKKSAGGGGGKKAAAAVGVVGVVGVGAAAAVATTTAKSSSPNKYTTPSANPKVAGGGMAQKGNEGDIDLSNEALGGLPNPPLGRPKGSPAAGGGGQGGDDDSPKVLMEFRQLVEKLVRQVMPTEINHIDELVDEYEGREAELLDTLTAMRENEDLLSASEMTADSDMSQSQNIPDTAENTSGGEQHVITNLLPAVLSEDEEIYEASPRMGNSPRSNTSDDSNDDGKNKAKVGAAVLGAAAVGGVAATTTAAADAPQDGKKKSIVEHFKDVAKVDDNLPLPIGGDANDSFTSMADHSTSTQHTSNVKEPKDGYLDNSMSTMSQAERAGRRMHAASGATGVPAAGGPTADENDPESGLTREDKKERPWRSCTSMRIMIGVIVFLLLAGVAAALGVVFGSSGGSNDGDPSKNNEIDDENGFTPRPPETPTIGGEVPTITKVPTLSPTPKAGPNDGYDPDAPMTSCNTPDTEFEHELGVKSLQGAYPKVAVDGNQAVVASGSGFVAFYTLNPSTKRWTRTEVFGTMPNVGEITSVAISGNSAVVGAPMAFTVLSENRDEPFETGAIFIYERNVLPQGGYSKWRQLKGARIPNEYKRNSSQSQFQKARFGHSVSIDGDLIVAGAPEESSNRGSITVFRKEEDATEEWEQVDRVKVDLCQAEFFGYSVQVYSNVIAASTDCGVNLILYDYKRDEGTLSLRQELEYKSPVYGAISSISMGWDNVVYSTVFGGLFFYRRQNPDYGSKYYLVQEMSFVSNPSLYEYPIAMDANMLTLAVSNDVYVYTQDDTNGQWKRESVVLESTGDYAGYVGASVDISEGQLLVSSSEDIISHDFTGCKRESSAPTLKPTNSPTLLPTVTPGQPTCLSVNLEFDMYPQDTSWRIESIADNFVMAKSPEFDAEVTTYSSQVCLPDGNYAFTIADVYGDGMCCDWGEGRYNVTSAKGDIIAEGAAYGAEERTEFTMPFKPDAPFVETSKPSPTPAPTPKPTVLVTPPPTPKPTVLVTPPPTLKPITLVTAPPTFSPRPQDCYTLDVTVVLDNYPPDTTWEIIPQGSSTAVYNSVPYDQSLANKADTQSVCLLEGTYDFIIYDEYGDGICCDWGEGSYQLAFDGNVVAEGGAFGPSETKTFSTPVSTPPECYDVSVNLNFDTYSEDTSWDITQDGSIVAASPSYTAGMDKDDQELCILGGDYVFTIYDVYLDGMCCKWGEGSYSVTANKEVIKEGGEFGPSESTAFSLPAAST